MNSKMNYSSKYEKQMVNHCGVLPSLTKCLYMETQVINNTDQTIYIKDCDNRETEIPMNYSGTSARVVEIRTRTVNGVRNIDSQLYEHWEGDIEVLIVHASDIGRCPIFVKEKNIIIYNDTMRSTATHPLYASSYERAFNCAVADVTDSLANAPLTIMINDSTGQFSHAYVELNGTIFEVPVKNNLDEDDIFKICMRDSRYGSRYSIIEGSVEELRNNKLYELKYRENHSFTFALSERLIANKLQLEAEKLSSLFSYDDIEKTRKSIEEKWRCELNTANDQNKSLKNQLTVIKDTHAQELDLKDREIKKCKSEIEHLEYRLNRLVEETKIGVEASKLQMEKTKCDSKRTISENSSRTAIAKADREIEMAELKAEKERLSKQSSELTVLANVVKAATVVIPILAAAAAWLVGRSKDTIGAIV